MKDKIEKYLYNHNPCKITAIMAEFLLDYKTVMDLLSELYREKKVKQIGDNSIEFCGDIKTEENKEEASPFQLLQTSRRSNLENYPKFAKKLFEQYDDDDEDDEPDDIDLDKEAEALFESDEWKNIVKQVEDDEDEEFDLDDILDSIDHEDDNNCGWFPELQKKIEATVDKIASADYDYEGKESWENQVMDVIEQIVGIDQSLNREQAVEIAKMLLEKTTDSMKRTIFLRTKREFEVATDQEYNLLRKQIFS